MFIKNHCVFSGKTPLVRYQIYRGNSENIKERIECGILDFGLVMEPFDISKYEYISMPVKEQWAFLYRIYPCFRKKEVIKPEDLQNTQLISAKVERMYREIRSWFREYYDQIEIGASGNLLYNEAIMAQEQIGAVLGIALDIYFPGLKFVPLSPCVETRTALTWKKTEPFHYNGCFH